MLEINFLAVVVVAIAAFVLSSVYYTLLSDQLAGPASSEPAATARMPAWKPLVEFIRSFVVATVLARVIALTGVDGWTEALQLGVLAWIGFPAVLLTGSVIWENVPWRRAALHAGDWLAKLLMMAVVLGVWR